jgi:hypothetical protein
MRSARPNRRFRFLLQLLPLESRADRSSRESIVRAMKYTNSSDRFQTLLNSALALRESVRGEALMLLAEGPLDWPRLVEQVAGIKIVVAVEQSDELEEAQRASVQALLMPQGERPVHERLGQALLRAVSQEMLGSGSRIVAMYSGFEADQIDSISVINLGEHLERLSPRDLRSLGMTVPLDTLKAVVDLALEIGREGREGHRVGTLFVVGDHRKVLEYCRSAGFDPVRGYRREERNLFDRRVQEGIKEIAQLDGATVVSADGTVMAACQIIDAPAKAITLSKGLGARHWAAAAITKHTKAVAVAVSESAGTVRLFQDGQLILRIEPFRRPMKWKDFDYEPPGGEG